ncbi:MAG: NAD(P)H-dependent oxidoreductase [Alphaproteobacteria bacterium]|nr:NAD(P)H-dependent oxidoreductase [Alphaproteobacteria bacterium]
MHIALISGSHRQNSQSLRVTTYLASRLPQLAAGTSTDIIELTDNPLPLWDEGMRQKDGASPLQKQWEPYAKRLQAADGFVVTSPEWNGMVPAGLKNFFLYCTPKDVGHKPALITAVSASRGGAYPITELRMSSYKNSMICYIPEHLIVRNAASMFVGDTPMDKDDEYLRGRADFALKILLEYAKSMKSVRDSGVAFDKKYANGM